MPQAELTLNMLRGTRLNPKVSALTQLNGHFDFNRTPIVPPGIQVLAHVKSANRTIWSHQIDGLVTTRILLYPTYTTYRHVLSLL